MSTPASYCRPASRTMRRAMALFAVMGTIAVLTMLAILYVTHTRNQTRLTHRFRSGEVAFQLAMAGVAAAFSELGSTGLDKELCTLLAGPPERLDGKSWQMDATAGPMARVVERVEASERPRINVTATFGGFRSLFTSGERSPAGMHPDLREKIGQVKVVSRATVDGVTREVECLKAAKLINPLLPLLGRFTLFVKNQPAGPRGVNGLDLEKKLLFPSPIGRLAPTAPHDALVLTNQPDPWEGGSVGRGALDRSGWVFLGSGSTVQSRWMLNSSFGGSPDGPFGEGFLLPRQVMLVTPPPEILAILPEAGQALMSTQLGLMQLKAGVFTKARSDSTMHARYPFENDPVLASSLHLYGTPARPSPTLVLGKAYRRFLVYSYLTNNQPPLTTTVKLPYLDVGDPAALSSHRAFIYSRGVPPSPFDPETILKQVFDDSVSSYELFMSNVVEEPWHRSLDQLEKNLTGPMDGDSFDPPQTLVDMTRVTKLLLPLDPNPERRRTFLYDPEDNSKVKLSSDRRAHFEGDLDRVGNDDLWLDRRATYVFRQDQWARWLADGKLRVAGIMVAEPRDGPLVIDRPLEVTEGGVIVTRGDIKILARVTCAASARTPLTLVSLEGDITIGADQVDAALVALGARGNVTRTAGGPLAIRGSVAAATLDLDALTKPPVADRATHTLAWDPRLDPVADEADTLRLYFDTRREAVLR